MAVTFRAEQRDNTFDFLAKEIEDAIKARLRAKMSEVLPHIIDEEVAKMVLKLFETVSFEDLRHRLVITVHKDKDNL